jgi:hypothetical protein
MKSSLTNNSGDRRPLLVVAPHLMHPARNGADISLERIARYSSLQADHVDLIGCSSIRRYSSGGLVCEQLFENSLRPKAVAGIRTVLLRSHYFRERFNTPEIEAVVRRHLTGREYGTVLASFLTSACLLPEPQASQRRLIWTHNDELEWFKNITAIAANPMTRMVAAQSLRWLHRRLAQLVGHATLLHVSESDRAGFEAVLPNHSNLVVAVGADLDPESPLALHRECDPVVLTFVGGLAVQMAFDALDHFHSVIEPSIREQFTSRLQVRVVGSSPAPAIRRLCAKAGWELRADVSDESLSQLLRETTFTILPFPYSNGIKLKLLRSLGSGVPFISTRACRPPGFKVPAGCCFADEPKEWCETISNWLDRADRNEVREELRLLAQDYSWPSVVTRMWDDVGRKSHDPAALTLGHVDSLPRLIGVGGRDSVAPRDLPSSVGPASRTVSGSQNGTCRL